MALREAALREAAEREAAVRHLQAQRDREAAARAKQAQQEREEAQAKKDREEAQAEKERQEAQAEKERQEAQARLGQQKPPEPALPPRHSSASTAPRARQSRAERRQKASYTCQRCGGQIVPSTQAWRGHRRGAKCLSYRAWQRGLRPWQACLDRGEAERGKWVSGELSDSPEPADLYGPAAGGAPGIHLRSRPRMDTSRRRSEKKERRDRSKYGSRRRRRKTKSSPVKDRDPDQTKKPPPGGGQGPPGGAGGMDKGQVLTSLFEAAARALASY